MARRPLVRKVFRICGVYRHLLVAAATMAGAKAISRRCAHGMVRRLNECPGQSAVDAVLLRPGTVHRAHNVGRAALSTSAALPA